MIIILIISRLCLKASLVKSHFVHNHNTRTASRNTYYIDQIRTNYGRFSLRFQGPKAWNSIELKKSAFKKEIAESLIRTYTSAATSYA